MPGFDSQPRPGEQVQILGDVYTFPTVPGRLGGVPYEVGKAARVYQLMQGDKTFALKAFFDNYRNPIVGQNSEALSNYSHLPGLTVAKRKVVTPEKHPELVQKFPTFAHAVLMPWTTGQSWANYVSGDKAISAENSLTLARTLANVLAGLEQSYVAHCDISNGNFVFSSDFKHLELVDIEEMFAEDLMPPHVLPVGTEGYALESVVQNGYRSVDADRFAGAILLVEILTWQFPDIREQREPGSLFASSEFGYKSKRYKLVSNRLHELPASLGLNNDKLAELFDQIWFSRWSNLSEKKEHKTIRDILQSCPTLQEWNFALEPVSKISGTPVASEPSKEIFQQTATLQYGMPRLAISTDLLDFGTIGNTARCASLEIRNIGSGYLKGLATALPWLLISPTDQIEQKVGETNIQIEFILSNTHPTREHGGLLRFPGAIIINTNGGTKVIGVQFRIEEQSFLKKLFG